MRVNHRGWVRATRKPVATITVSDNGGTYDGTPYAATGDISGVNGDDLGTPTFTYYLASDTTFTKPLPGAPMNAGNYVVVASFTPPRGVTLSELIALETRVTNAQQAIPDRGPDPAAQAALDAAQGALHEALGDYAPATSAPLPFTITRAPLTYQIGDDYQAEGIPADLAADLPDMFATGINGETLSIGSYVSSGNTAAARPGTYAINGTVGNGTGLASNYKVKLPPGTLTVEGPGATQVGGILFLVGGSANDQINVRPVGTSGTGATGVQLDANLAGIDVDHQVLGGTTPVTAIVISGFGGNDNINLDPRLTIPGTVVEGDGNDNIQLGDGNNTITVGGGNDNIQAGDGSNVVTVGPPNAGPQQPGPNPHPTPASNNHIQLGNGNNSISAGDTNLNIQAGDGSNTVMAGNGNDQVQLGDGNTSVTVGSGNDQIQAGDGNNLIVAGGGNDHIQVGNGDNLIVGGAGQDNIQAGNGDNILIDGTAHATGGDTLAQVLAMWESDIANSDSAAAIAGDLSNYLFVSENVSNPSRLQAGRGFDAFFTNYAQDANAKAGDLLNDSVVPSPSKPGPQH